MGDVKTNVLIDGMNIVYRCHFIYDMKQNLRSSEGIPTGTVYGFARHIVKLRDRFPSASYYVVWEGRNSRKERRDIYAGYKANRDGAASNADFENSEDEVVVFDQLEAIKGMLESVGVHQVSADNYEADDVIATLVRERFSGDKFKNIIVSSDRDLLQLVNDSTVLMTPRAEKFYDRFKVEQEYGVPPRLLLAYRTFDGDKSDNLPGLYRFPRKKIAAIVKEHGGDLESIYTECKLKLTEFQTKTLEDFEEQAYINRRVMKMRSVHDYDLRQGEHDADSIKNLCAQLEIESIRADLLSFSAKTGFVKTGIADAGTLHSTTGPTGACE